VTVYWMLLAWAVLWALQARAPQVSGSGALLRVPLNGLWWFTAGVLTLVIGFRFQVGGDWAAYLRYVQRAADSSLPQILTLSDPGYLLLNWFSVQLGLHIWGVNLFAGGVFAYGLAVFCRQLPRPWLALVAAIPYMVIVVSMGYTRQGVALAFAMLALVALGQQKVRTFVFWVLLGATFHKSAVLLLPMAALAVTVNRYWIAFWVGVVSIMAYVLLLGEAIETVISTYVDAEYQSEGAFVRLAMNALPALILLIWHRRFRFPAGQLKLWIWFAIFSLLLFAALWVTPATALLDRVALYMLPLQLVVFSYFPDAFGRTRLDRTVLLLGVVLYYSAVQFVWLNMATHASAWLPYRFYPLEMLSL
jgi:hypothetical protein